MDKFNHTHDTEEKCEFADADNYEIPVEYKTPNSTEHMAVKRFHQGMWTWCCIKHAQESCDEYNKSKNRKISKKDQ